MSLHQVFAEYFHCGVELNKIIGCDSLFLFFCVRKSSEKVLTKCARSGTKILKKNRAQADCLYLSLILNSRKTSIFDSKL